LRFYWVRWNKPKSSKGRARLEIWLRNWINEWISQNVNELTDLMQKTAMKANRRKSQQGHLREFGWTLTLQSRRSALTVWPNPTKEVDLRLLNDTFIIMFTILFSWEERKLLSSPKKLNPLVKSVSPVKSNIRVSSPKKP
jgi:hypothetical protein